MCWTTAIARYELNGEDSRTLATVGAFRVVSERELRDPREEAFDPRDDDHRHLRDQGLMRSVSLDGRERVVTLTERGRSLLECHRRDRDDERHQEFHAGVSRPRELTHDAAALSRLPARRGTASRARRADIRRVVLENELKREYQAFLQEHNRGRPDSDGRPDREPREIEEWAREHDLPYFDEQVHFPDFRIEYEDCDGRDRHEDIEVVTEHYRGAHAAAAARADSPAIAAAVGRRRRARRSIRAWRRTSYEPLRPAENCATASGPNARSAIAAFGFTERQARFLVHVLVHAGVFVERQYRAFAGIAHGQKTHDFLAKLVSRGYATAITPGALHRGRLFHVQYKPLYEAIGEPNNRNREAGSLGRMVERLMLLDAVLADRHYTWLGTERDKVTYFVDRLQKDLPRDVVSASHVRRGHGEDHPVLPGQAPDRRAARWRPAARVPLPGDPRGARRVPAVSPAPCRPAQDGRRMDDPPPRPAPISEGGGALSLCRPGCVHHAADAISGRRARWFFRSAPGPWRREPAPDPDLDLATAAQKFGAARVPRAPSAVGTRGYIRPLVGPVHDVSRPAAARRGRIEFVELSHQYLQLTSLVGVA